MQSETWREMTPAEQEAERVALRRILDDMQAKSASKPPETRDLIRCLESFYAADRIESCRSLATVLMVEERGYSDAMLGAVGSVVIAIMDLERALIDPSLN